MTRREKIDAAQADLNKAYAAWDQACAEPDDVEKGTP